VNPFANNLYDLGASETSWKNIYASGTLSVKGVTSIGTVGTTAATDPLHVFGTKNSITIPTLGGLQVEDTTARAIGVGGILVFRGNYVGTSPTTAAAIHACKTNNNDGDYGFDLCFNTRVNGGNNTEKVRITTGGILRPSLTNTGDLGTAALSWKSIFASSTVAAGGVTSTGHVNPFANNLYDLGAYGTAWKNIYSSGTSYLTNIYASSGSTGAPSYSFVGDTDTGMYVTTTNTLAFEAGGNNVMNITTNQVTMITDLVPVVTGLYNLGQTSFRWNAKLNAVNASDLIVNSGATTTYLAIGTGVNSNINPIVNATYDLGSSALYWKNSYTVNASNTGITFAHATGTKLDVVDNDIYNSYAIDATGTAAGRFLRAYANDGDYDDISGVIGMVTDTLATLSAIPSMNTIAFDTARVESAGGFFITGDTNGTGGAQAGILALNQTSSTKGAAIMGARRCGTSTIANILQLATDADQSRFSVRCNGQIWVDNGTVGTPGDYAEYFYTADTDLTAGEVVALNEGSATSVKRALAGDRKLTLGVISANPLVVGNAGPDGAYESNPNFKIVGLLGQLDVLVTDANGLINVGDQIMVGDDGRAVKAKGAGMVLGRALESLTTATGTIKVFISPIWSADGVFEAAASSTVMVAQGTASVTAPAYDSYGITFQGSAWSTTSSQAINSSFTLINEVTNASSSSFVLQGTLGNDLLTVSDAGDVAMTGDLTVGRRLFLGNKTTGQGSTSTYIFVDDTSAPGLTYISTNAAGWTADTSYDYAEMFGSDDRLVPGDIVVADPNGQERVKRSASAFDTVLGIVSTKPGFITGARSKGGYPIALAGRVPTRVSAYNGAIKPGDQLAPSDIPGVAVKAVETGPIIGIALESYENSGEGLISVFVQPGWKAGAIVESGPEPAAIVYEVDYSAGISPRSGLAKIAAGAKEVQINFETLNSYPLITATPYGQVTGGWHVTNVTDYGFTIIVGEAPTFDLVFAWKAEPSPEGSTVWMSDGTSAPYDPLSGQTLAPELVPEESAPTSTEELVEPPTSTEPVLPDQPVEPEATSDTPAVLPDQPVEPAPVEEPVVPPTEPLPVEADTSTTP
jgi:hypothetical protein